ncbi:MAG: cation diffusion facilitator family transporter [Bacteriovoracaceae bacterium]|nr:cation diffusion facilitator family transporter [Bacteriovoracaceae bacterium]
MASGSKKVIYAALIANFLISICKFAGAFITKSSAMFSEGIHSLVDTGNQVLLLFGMKQAKKPADENFPFGHGKEIYFWSFIVSILIFAVGAGFSLYEGIHSLFVAVEPKDPTINYIILGGSIIFESIAWYMALKEMRAIKGKMSYLEAVEKGKDPTMFVILFEDTAALLGLFIALIGVSVAHYTGNHIYDSIASILIGLILASTAIWLAYETKGLLIGEAAESELIESIKEKSHSVSGVSVVGKILTMHVGPEFILVNMDINISDDLGTANAVKSAIKQLDQLVKSLDSRIKRVYIEVS